MKGYGAGRWDRWVDGVLTGGKIRCWLPSLEC